MDWRAWVRKVQRLVGARRDRARLWLARVRRWFLRKPAFIGITGSVGKTTCKELVLAILSRHLRGSGTEENLSAIQDTARLILQASSRDQYCVAELGIMARGDMDKLVRFVRPSIGVVTAIGTDHISAFGSREGIAEEKGRLIASLPPTGVAILNADDPLVLAMRTRCAARVMTYGMVAGADVRGEILSAGWPERLKLRVRTGRRADRAADAVLRNALDVCHSRSNRHRPCDAHSAAGLRRCHRRDTCIPGPHAAGAVPGGATFIRDDFKAGPWTIDAAFGFVREARARRKIIVVGMLSDSTGKVRKHYVSVARRALEVADQVIFAGPWAARALRSVAAADRARLHVFSSVGLANDCLQQMLHPGDLVLLKGTSRKDHLCRLVLAREMDVRCWRDDCNFHHFCRYCEFLGVASGHIAVSVVPAAYDAAATVAGPRAVIVVGLGNPGKRYDRTRHNLGHAVLDRLASHAGASWTEEHGVRIARFAHAGLAVVLAGGRRVWSTKAAPRCQTCCSTSGAGSRTASCCSTIWICRRAQSGSASVAARAAIAGSLPSSTPSRPISSGESRSASAVRRPGLQWPTTCSGSTRRRNRLRPTK